MPPPRGIAEAAAPQAGRPRTSSAAPRCAQAAAARPARAKSSAPGSTVEHPKYGRGTVLRREGEGEDAKLTVSFPGYGLKKLMRNTQESRYRRMNTKNVTDKEERKKLKRAARKKAAPKAKRAAGVARGSQKKKVKKMVKGQRKR